ncbi:MAG: CBS domain-containing protein [Candidatus Aenigmatarchaeota archaeon]
MRISEIMSKNVVVLKPNNTMKHTLALFKKHRMSGFPVVNSKKRLVGVVSETDIVNIIDVYHGVQKSESSLMPILISIMQGGEKFENVKANMKKILKMCVNEFMKKRVVSVDINEDAYVAVRLMNKKNINRLPVVKNGRLAGIVTRTDIINALIGLE